MPAAAGQRYPWVGMLPISGIDRSGPKQCDPMSLGVERIGKRISGNRVFLGTGRKSSSREEDETMRWLEKLEAMAVGVAFCEAGEWETAEKLMRELENRPGRRAAKRVGRKDRRLERPAVRT